MEEAMRPYLRDRKLDMPLRNKDDSVALILEWFLHGINEVEVPDRIDGQLEDERYNRALYETLGWQEERHFDVVSSFWSVFACAVIVEVHEERVPLQQTVLYVPGLCGISHPADFRREEWLWQRQVQEPVVRGEVFLERIPGDSESRRRHGGGLS